MSYRIEKNSEGTNELVIDGFQNGIASSPYLGTGNIRNLNTSYYPGVAYVNYRRQATTLSDDLWYAGTHSTNVSNNSGWTFTAPVASTMSTPVAKATSPNGFNYVLDDTGSVFKQTAANSSTFNKISSGTGRIGTGSKGLAYWNNYLVVFGSGLIEFCGDGTGDSTVNSTHWNYSPTNTAPTTVNATFVVNSPATTDMIFNETTGINSVSGGITVGSRLTFTTTNTLPAPLVVGTTYFVKTWVGGTATMTISATNGGSAITLTDSGSGTHTAHWVPLTQPDGNITDMVFTALVAIGATTATIASYTTPAGTSETIWKLASGQYSVVDAYGNNLLATFTNGSATVTFLAPIVYPIVASTTLTVKILETTATTYKTLVSKVDGNLYFANGRNVGRILSQNTNISFNPGQPDSYVVDYAVVEVLQPQDTVVDLIDLKSTMIIAGQYDIYTWDYVSASVSAPSPVGELIVGITNLLSNIYILAGTKGNIYISNGYSAQFFYKIPDYVSGTIDPIWKYGGLMVHRSKLWFQLLCQANAGANILAGIFSLNVTAVNDVPQNALNMESQNSYGLTPSTGVSQQGVLMDNETWSNGEDSYYSAWSSATSTGGIDYNDTSLWQNFEPVIETDIIPLGSILDKQTLGNAMFKLDRPLASGDSLRLSWRPSLSSSYTVIGITTTTQLSEYWPSNIFQAQWTQFMVEFDCASSDSSYIPLREIRIPIQ